MKFDRKDYNDDQLLQLYEALLRPRMIEEKMLILLRQNKISKWFSGIGQEAISVGITQALQPDEYILPMHRNLGVFTGRNLPLERLFAQWQGTGMGYTKGRDRSFHFGTNEHHIVGMISHLGPQNGVADGIALASRLRDEKKVTVVFNGDGGTSEGDFHEGLNVAAVWDLPVIFVVENNGYGLSTPSLEQFRCKQFIDKAIGYGITGVQIDGNNILEVYDTVRTWSAKLRKNPKPILLECLTFRMRGHEEASGTKYVPKKLMDEWGRKDPVQNYEDYLMKEKVLDKKGVEGLRKKIKQEIEVGLEKAFAEAHPVPDTELEVKDCYAPFQQGDTTPPAGRKSEKRFIDAISDGLRQGMERHDNLVLMGQDIAEYGGVFKITEGFVSRFGKNRVRNTPLCEAAIVGAGLGLSIKGMKAMVEMQFADFVTEGFNQIINNLAKTHWRWGQAADVVVRMPTGAGTAAGPFHSQSNEAWFFHTPGLKIVYPSNPYDAKGLLCAALDDPNPYLYFEHKLMYRSLKEQIPDDYYQVEIGKAKLVREGSTLSIITYGMGVHWATEILNELPDISADIVDLRTLLPWDKEAVADTVRKTNRVLILHEDTLTGGIGGEISAWTRRSLSRQPWRTPSCPGYGCGLPSKNWLVTNLQNLSYKAEIHGFVYLSLFYSLFLNRSLELRTTLPTLVKACGVLILLFCFLFTIPVAGQNTKGDRPPVGNQRQVKDTKSKSYKRKERGSTKDIAGRRLRTRGQSSASRANAQHRQPPTTKRRPDRHEERSAPPRGRVFSRAPQENRVRAWRGDVSGYRMRRLRPTGRDAARNNVYPQKGLYVRYARKRPKERPPIYKRTIKGTKFVERKPRAQERAWTGGLEHGPLRNQSATGTVKNTYTQQGPYVRYYNRRASTKSKSFSNREQVSRAKRYSRAPRLGGSQPRFYPASGTQPYVQRGRKNVYWGKYQKKERPVTTDLTGGPLRTRNYHSQPIGLVGRDTLVYYGRKPSEDRGKKSPPSGYRTTGRASQGWKGDVAGWPVRSPRARRGGPPKKLSPTLPGLGADWINNVFNRKFRGVKPKDRVPSTAMAKYSGNIPLTDKTKGFSDGGAEYSGNIKGGRPGFNKSAKGYTVKGSPSGFSRDGAGYSGNVKRKGKPDYSRSFRRYSGHMPRGALSEFNPLMYGYSGYIKRSDIKGMSKQGANYSGNLRRVSGFGTEYAGYSGNLPKSAAAKQFEDVGFEYQGFIIRRNPNRARVDGIGKTKHLFGQGFTRDGAGFSGTTKAKRPAKGGGSISGMWNNDGSPLAKTPPFNSGGADFSGRTKYKRPAKGGGSISGMWNNDGSPLAKTPPFNTGGADFSGRTKYKRPAKGGGSISFRLWNNQESSLAKTPPINSGGADFSGRTKYRRPEKGGGSISGIIWNNNESALAKSAPANADAPSGLQIRVKEKQYARKKNASRDAMPGIAPTSASVKASEYSRSMKMYWNYKHNPNSSKDALRTIGPNKADARIRDYQGNARMRKYSVSGRHPDAKFAHLEDDNVKGERGLLTSVKLFWEKMFNKSGTQPTNVKDKNKKVQYDKREKGLWAY